MRNRLTGEKVGVSFSWFGIFNHLDGVRLREGRPVVLGHALHVPHGGVEVLKWSRMFGVNRKPTPWFS